MSLFAVSACGEDEEAEQTHVRGMVGFKDNEDGDSEGKTGKAGVAGAEPGKDQNARAERPKILLTREDFSEGARDPFQGFLAVSDEVPGDSLDMIKSRSVQMSSYSFEDLRLIGIVRSGKNVQARALFVSNDGKSKAIRQGEYFSRAEVLLSAVNRDYVEIEVVDEDKTQGMNWPVGERRAIYLKEE